MSMRIIISIAATLLSGCGVERDACDGKEQIVVYRAELRTALTTELISAGVWFKEGVDRSICYDPSDAEFVVQRLKAIDLEQRPRNRIVVPSGVAQELLFSRLKSEDIKFELIPAEGQLVLVFENEETAAQAFGIVGEIYSELSRAAK